MTTRNESLDASVLALDADKAIDTVCDRLREVLRGLSRRGLVVAMSGGIDSSVCAALAAKALGPTKVFGLLLPERDSSSKSTQRGKLLAKHLDIQYEIQDIAPALEAIGCYRWRDDAIRRVFPDYGEGWRNKIAISGGVEGRINHFQLIVQS